MRTVMQAKLLERNLANYREGCKLAASGVITKASGLPNTKSTR